MLRLMAVRDLLESFKYGPSLVPCFAKKQLKRFPLSQSSVWLQRVYINTKSPARKDAPLPNSCLSEGAEMIDLDKWKTVMRLKAASEDKPQEVEDEDHVSDEESVGDLSLEATRELVSMWRQAGKLVPEEMTDEELRTLAGLPTKSSRKKYLKYLSVKEGHKKARKEKQQKKRADREASLEQKNEVDTEEGDEQKEPECKNTFLLQFWSRSLDKLLAWRSAQAMVFGQPIVFDMSYEANMSKREIENTVSQLMEVEAWNRRASDPYHLHFCNLQRGSYYSEQLLKRYGAETWDRLLITSTDQQHFEVFTKEDLVYLTADSPNVLRTYDHSKVYIVGALVDRSIQSGLSLANAKRLKLATARLPLDEFLHWDTGAKNLTLDQMIRIMLTLKETGKWEEALKFVPTRKHDGFHPQQKAVEIKSEKISLKHVQPNYRKLKPTVNRHKTVKSCEEKGKHPSRDRNWWHEE